MEERGRGRPVPKRRRLLTAIALAALSAPAALFAVDVSVFVSTFELEAGSPLVVELSVQDADPSEVALSDFSVPPSFAAVAGRKELRYAGADAITVISREWVPSEGGAFTVGPFPLVVRGERVIVAPVRITVTERPTASGASLSWRVGSPGETTERATTGAALTIYLEASFTGTFGAVSCPAPENAILEPVSFPVPAGTRLSATPSDPAVVAVLKWTPLETGRQDLPNASMRFVDSLGAERVVASVPAGVTVARGNGGEPSLPGPVGGRNVGAGDSGDDGGIGGIALPANASTANASSAGMPVAERLASLRRAEYTSFFPASARNERIALEDSLSLSPSLPVPPAAWKPVAVIGSVACFSLAFALRLVGRPSRKRGRAFRGATFSLFLASLALVIVSISLYTRDRGESGVCRSCELYHVPEAGSSVIGSLPEGFAARVERRIGEWAYVMAADGMAGWVRSDAIIDYTTGN